MEKRWTVVIFNRTEKRNPVGCLEILLIDESSEMIYETRMLQKKKKIANHVNVFAIALLF